MSSSPRTPCIGICSTGIGDDVCRGCKRFAHEVIEWNSYTVEEQQAVLKRIDGFLVQIMQTKFTIVDTEVLHQQIQYQQIAFDQSKDPHTWLFELLRWGAGQIQDLSVYGVKCRPLCELQSLADIKNAVDKEVYDLACAYYQRYVVPGLAYEVIV